MSSYADLGAPTTTTITVSEVASATVVLEIDYSEAQNLAFSERITSPDISVGGHTWNCVYYPSGTSREDNDEQNNVSPSLCLHHECNSPCDAVAHCVFAIVTTEEGSSDDIILQSHTSFITSFRGYYYAGYSGYCSVSSLPNYTRDGNKLTLLCTLTVPPESVTSDQEPTEWNPPLVALPIRDVGDHLMLLRGLGEGADHVHFHVGGEVIAAHKFVLAARSSFFEAMFYGPLASQAIGEPMIIRIDNMEQNIFKIILNYMYMDSLPSMDEDCGAYDVGRHDSSETSIVLTQHLYAAADYYQLDRLTLCCE